jgi:hypothetical protein
MTLAELKIEDKLARKMLIILWSELSGCSKKFAKQDLKDGIGGRYQLDKNHKGELSFFDSISGDRFKYSIIEKCWIYQ